MNEEADEALVEDFLLKTVTALRMFVNDELNQLDFAIREIATRFLKPEFGTLAVIVHNEPEKHIVRKCLKEVNTIEADMDREMTDKELEKLKSPWKIIHGGPPLAYQHMKGFYSLGIKNLYCLLLRNTAREN